MMSSRNDVITSFSNLSSVANFSNFFAKFSNFSDYPCNFFFQKHLATNLAIFKIDLATFSTFW